MCLSIVYEGKDTGAAGIGTTDCVAAGARRLCADVSTQVEVIIMGAGAVARFPDLFAVLFAPVEAKLGFAEVRTGNGRDAVVIAETILVKDKEANTVHLGGAYCPIFVGQTRDPGLSSYYEGEDARTTGVRSRHSVAAGARRLCADVSAQVEVIIMRACSITRFPLLKAFFSTHIES